MSEQFKVASLVGKVFIKDESGNLHAMELGQTIPVGAVIVTADGARVDLSQVTGNESVSIAQNRTVDIDKILQVADEIAQDKTPDITKDAFQKTTVSELDAVLNALNSGEDPLASLAATAAGGNNNPQMMGHNAPESDGSHPLIHVDRLALNVVPGTSVLNQPELSRILDFQHSSQGQISTLTGVVNFAQSFAQLITPAGGGAAGGTGGGTAETPFNPASVFTPAAGMVSAGLVTATNTLRVEAYAADGVTKLAEGTVDEVGRFVIDLDNYTGPVILKVIDSDTAADYWDEATGTTKDLNADLVVMGIAAAGGVVTLNINPLTAIAYQVMLDSGLPMTADNVNAVNHAIAVAFGLDSITALSPTVINDGSFTGSDSEAEQYGVVLAVLSGIDANMGGDTAAAIRLIASGISIGADGLATLSNAVVDAIMEGAYTVAQATEGMGNGLGMGLLATMLASVFVADRVRRLALGQKPTSPRCRSRRLRL